MISSKAGRTRSRKDSSPVAATAASAAIVAACPTLYQPCGQDQP
jgi:hypothetical protein